MNWELFFLICFVVGLTFSVVSFLGGLSRFHLHVPKHFHFGGHAGHVGGHIGHGAQVGHAGHAQAGPARTAHFPIVNPMTIAAFLTWFGGTGYLLVHLQHIWIFAGLALSAVAGLIGASIVFLFIGKVLMRNEGDLDPLDYEMVGVLGRVSSSVRSGGTGEIIFVQEGVRKPCAARSDAGDTLDKGEEVIVTRYERGVAYVRKWEEMANPQAAEAENTKKDS